MERSHFQQERIYVCCQNFTAHIGDVQRKRKHKCSETCFNLEPSIGRLVQCREGKQLCHTRNQKRESTIPISGIAWYLVDPRKKNPGRHIRNQPICSPTKRTFVIWRRRKATNFVLRPSTLGIAMAETLHDENCGASASASAARTSKYFPYTPSPGPLFKRLSKNCYRCRRIKVECGTNVISPLRHIAQDTMIEGISIQVDMCGPYTDFTRARHATTRETREPKTTQVKLWILVCLDYFMSRVETAILEDMLKKSVSSALHEILSTQG